MARHPRAGRLRGTAAAATGGDVDFSAEPTGTLIGVGLRERRRRRPVPPRLRRRAAERRRDRTRRDGLRHSEVHHPHRERRRARRRPDGPAVRRRSTRRRISSCRSTRASKRRTSTPDDYWYPSSSTTSRYDDAVWAVPQFYQPPAILLNMRVMDEAGVTTEEIDTSDPDTLLARDREDVPGVAAAFRRASGFDPVSTGAGATCGCSAGRPAHRRRRQADARRPEQRRRHRPAEADQRRAGRLRDGEELHRLVRHVRREQPVRRRPGRVRRSTRSGTRTCCRRTSTRSRSRRCRSRTANGEPVLGRRRHVVRDPGRRREPLRGVRVDDRADQRRRVDGGRRGSRRDARGGRRHQHRSVHRLARGRPVDPRASTSSRVRQRRASTRSSRRTTTCWTTARSFGSSPAGQDIQTELNNAVTAALLGEKTPEEALADAQEAAMRAYENATAG